MATITDETVELPMAIFTAAQTEAGVVGGLGIGVGTGVGVIGVVGGVGKVEFVDTVVVTLDDTDTVLVEFGAGCTIWA